MFRVSDLALMIFMIRSLIKLAKHNSDKSPETNLK